MFAGAMCNTFISSPWLPTYSRVASPRRRGIQHTALLTSSGGLWAPGTLTRPRGQQLHFFRPPHSIRRGQPDGVGAVFAMRGGGSNFSSNGAIGATLLIVSILSATMERRTAIGKTLGGSLLSFATLCVLSNAQLVPATHPIYDLCWTTLLPMSLVVIILGNTALSTRRPIKPSPSLGLEAVRGSPMSRVGLAYVIGAAGSLLGAVLGFCSVVYPWPTGSVLSLPRETAAQVAGALTATYIGGSVNLFAVAAAVGLSSGGSTTVETGAEGASILGALAAVDVFLMAIYFTGLIAANRAPFLQRAFPSPPRASDPERSPTSVLGSPGCDGVPGKSHAKNGHCEALYHVGSVLLALATGYTVCAVGNAFALRVPLPGVATMIITVLSALVATLLGGVALGAQRTVAGVSPGLASVLLNMFFAAVGASGRISIVVGASPTLLLFAAVALAVHVASIFLGSYAMNRALGPGLVGLGDVIVASNANIGGASTAATFAGLIGRPSLVVPGAWWGTVGYAVASVMGVGMWALLR
ncbi:unnamed protein product [Discosporangium mesarthrocarpum]